jgi:hypothetical protein
MGRFPNISELFIWNDGQAGAIRIPSTSPTSYVSLQADGNRYTSLDLAGALRNPASVGIVSFQGNRLSSIDVSGCVQITELHLAHNALDAAQLDALLAAMDSIARTRSAVSPDLTLLVDIRGNATPGDAGRAHAVSLAAKGWTVMAEGWTEEPPPPPDTGETRIDFTTAGDATSMRCDFRSPATATWHWSDGTESAAASTAAAAKAGLGAGEHAHWLIISNGAALTRFGASDGGGQGRLVSIDGLDACILLDILYCYNEAALATLCRTEATRIREFHLWGTGLPASRVDGIFSDAVATGVLNGRMWCPSAGTAASDADRATLAARGWSLAY